MELALQSAQASATCPLSAPITARWWYPARGSTPHFALHDWMHHQYDFKVIAIMKDSKFQHAHVGPHCSTGACYLAKAPISRPQRLDVITRGRHGV